MDSTQEDNYLQKITELIYDDNEIVTSTKLANILNVRVDHAQTLLNKYVQNADEPDQTDVSWTYLIIGKNENDNISIFLSKCKEVDEKKKILKSIVSQQVYSIHRNPDIDLIALANVEPITENNIKSKPLLGSVVSRNAIKRKLKDSAKVSNETKIEIIEPKNQNRILESTNKTKKTSIDNFCIKGPTQKNNIKSTPSVKSKQKNVMANFFGKQPNKTESTNGRILPEKELEKLEDIEGSMKDTKVSTQHEKDTGSSEEREMQVDPKPETKAHEIAENKNDEDKKTASKQNQKSKKRRSEAKSKQPSKKRKRIVEANDSDSDIFVSSESEIEVEPDIHLSDDNYVEEKKIEGTLPTKSRRMKQVTEEFMDEDGYINTVQKYVMVSDEETQEHKEQIPLNILTEKSVTEVVDKKDNTAAPPVKKEISPKKPTKGNKTKASKGNQNQPSIMNFFKKT